MRYARPCCTACVLFGVAAGTVQGQITGHQRRIGQVRSAATDQQAQLSPFHLDIAVQGVDRDLIRVRLDAKRNRSKCPREAARCIEACERLDSAIREAKLELAALGYTTQAHLSAIKAALEPYQKAVRDYSEALNHPVQPYRLPGWKIGKSKMGSS